ncbi:hypothetical protein WN943_013550 [Citrus x changshan-huyou]
MSKSFRSISFIRLKVIHFENYGNLLERDLDVSQLNLWLCWKPPGKVESSILLMAVILQILDLLLADGMLQSHAAPSDASHLGMTNSRDSLETASPSSSIPTLRM